MNRLLSLFFVALVAGVAALAWIQTTLRDQGPLEEPVSVVIKQGRSSSDIAADLRSSGVIEHAWFFLLYTRVGGSAGALQAGEYTFEPGVAMTDVISKLVRGETVVHALTVAEGLASHEIVALLDAAPLLQGEIDTIPEEGSLLPETYHYSRGEQRTALIARMEQAMQKLLAELWETRATNLPFENASDALVLASIVEKETGLAEEREHIAGVLINRLRRGMPLQSDPTVIYAISRHSGPMDRPLLRTDWKFDDPYNTYMHRGLPPGPIANPGRAAIMAVLQPLETRDLYFVADGTGGHNFAATLRQHNRNVAAYRKVMEEKQASGQESDKEP